MSQDFFHLFHLWLPFARVAQQLEFERAARLRDQIHGITAIHSVQAVTRNSNSDIDAVALVSGDRPGVVDKVPAGRDAWAVRFTTPSGLLAPFYRLWFDRVVPLLGRVFRGGAAYTYLPASVRRFR